MFELLEARTGYYLGWRWEDDGRLWVREHESRQCRSMVIHMFGKVNVPYMKCLGNGFNLIPGVSKAKRKLRDVNI